MKTKSNGRRPPMQDNPPMEEKLQWKIDQTIFCKCFKCRRPPIEDDLKILKVKYLSNRLLDHTEILNLDWDDQSKVFKSFKWRRSPMEDDLKILKMEYLINHLLDPTQISNLSLYGQTIMYKSFKWRQPPIEDDLNILKVEYLSNYCGLYGSWLVSP